METIYGDELFPVGEKLLYPCTSHIRSLWISISWSTLSNALAKSNVWKILSQNAPNHINMEFRQNSRLRLRVTIPRTAAQAATRLSGEPFAVHAGKLWNMLPKEVTVVWLSNSLHNSRYFLVISCTRTQINRQQKDTLESPVQWPATGLAAV